MDGPRAERSWIQAACIAAVRELWARGIHSQKDGPTEQGNPEQIAGGRSSVS